MTTKAAAVEKPEKIDFVIPYALANGNLINFNCNYGTKDHKFKCTIEGDNDQKIFISNPNLEIFMKLLSDIVRCIEGYHDTKGLDVMGEFCTQLPEIFNEKNPINDTWLGEAVVQWLTCPEFNKTKVYGPDYDKFVAALPSKTP